MAEAGNIRATRKRGSGEGGRVEGQGRERERYRYTGLCERLYWLRVVIPKRGWIDSLDSIDWPIIYLLFIIVVIMHRGIGNPLKRTD